MRQRKARADALIYLALAIGSVARAERPTDTIVLRDGTSVRGVVENVGRDQVAIKSQDNPKQLETGQIQTIRFGGEPAGLASVREQIKNSQWEAATLTAKRLEAGDKDPLIQREVEFYQAFVPAQIALREGRGQKEAARELYKFAQNHKNDSHHFYEAADTLGRLAIQLGSFDAARKQYAEMKQATAVPIKLRGYLGEAEALAHQGPEKEVAAKAILEQAVAIPAKDPESVRFVTIAKIRHAALTAQESTFDAAVDTIKQILADGDEQDAALFAEAYLNLGKIQERAKRPKDAVLDYLHIDHFYPSESACHAEALSRLGQLFPQIGMVDEGAEAKRRWQERYGGGN